MNNMQRVLSRIRISLAIVDTLFLILCFLDSFLRKGILLIYIWFTDSVHFAGEYIAIYLITTFPLFVIYLLECRYSLSKAGALFAIVNYFAYVAVNI